MCKSAGVNLKDFYQLDVEDSLPFCMLSVHGRVSLRDLLVRALQIASLIPSFISPDELAAIVINALVDLLREIIPVR